MKPHLYVFALAIGLILSLSIHPGSKGYALGDSQSPVAGSLVFEISETTGTPGLSSTSSPTPLPPTATSKKPPTRTPRPTATPLTIPPPSNPNRINMMIGFGVLSVIVIILGVWLNRHRTP